MKHIFFDFDSTLVTLETLDEALKIVLENHPNKIGINLEIEKITNLGMNGEISQKESILKRLKIASLQKNQIERVSQKCTQNLSAGIFKLIKFLHQNNWQVFIVSAGFNEMIYETADMLNISRKNCFANNFIFDGNDIIGINEENPLVGKGGKSEVVNNILKNTSQAPKSPISEELEGEENISVFVGDGMTDFSVYQNKVVNYFCGYGINIVREKVQKNAENFFINPDDLFAFLKKV